MSDASSEIDRLAAVCASRLPGTPGTFPGESPPFAEAWQDLLSAVRTLDERFAFDLDGRPGALAAIRQALPAIEADLLDAVLDDVACEIAATREALYRVALAARSS